MKKRQNVGKSLTSELKEPKISIQRGPNLLNEEANYRGDSVREHKRLEEANEFITGEEIKQQNENL